MENCVRKIHFCYGHRIMDHEHKCATLHGHNGIVWIHATPQGQLDDLGRVIDFSVLKDRVGSWIEENWDHTTILYQKDQKTIDLVKQAPSKKEPFILNSNPTAENLAYYLLWEVCPKVLKNHGIIVSKITFWETESCYVEQSLNPNEDKILRLYGDKP